MERKRSYSDTDRPAYVSFTLENVLSSAIKRIKLDHTSTDKQKNIEIK